MESLTVKQDSNVIGVIELQNIRYPFNYSVGEADLVLKTTAGNSELKKVKAVINKTDKLELVAIVSKNFAVIPNQLVQDMVAEVSKDLSLETLSVKYTRTGYAMRIDLLSDRKEAVELNDLVQFGVSIRNSIDGTTALAVDMFTYRLACRNGATAKVSNLTFNAKHIGDANRLLERFRDALRTALENCSQLLELYRKATRIKVDRSIAEKVAELNLPYLYYRYTPIRIKVVKEGGEEERKEIEVLRETTLWEVFNGITYAVTHKSRANPIARSRITHRLHRVLAEVVATH